MRSTMVAVALVTIAAIAYAVCFDCLAAGPVSVIDRVSGRPVAGVVGVYETVTGSDGVAKVPTTVIAHVPGQGVSRKSPHIVVITAGWMQATQWDARWNDHTVVQHWDNSDQALYDLEGYLNSYCEFTNVYNVRPEQMKLYHREIVAWLHHFDGARASKAIMMYCADFH